jgi:hypothetical protein
VAVDSYAATSLAKGMDHSILDSIAHYPEGSPFEDSLDPQFVSAFILGLANDIQAVLEGAMVEATTISPHKPSATPSMGTLPRHLWPQSVHHDIANIRRRAKAIRRIIKHETRNRADAHEEPTSRDTSLPLWSRVNTPLSLRTILSPPPKDLDTLGLSTRPDLNPLGNEMK